MGELRRCGRLGQHEPHDWVGHENKLFHMYGTPSRDKKIEFHCPGRTVTEGGWSHGF